MKKFLSTIIAVAATVAVCGMAVCAAPSPSNVGAIEAVAEAKAADGTVLQIEAEPTTVAAPTTEVMKAVATSETAKAVLESGKAATIGVVDLEKIGDGNITFPIDVTVKVAGVTAGTKLIVLHNPTSDGATWVEENAVCGEGTVTIKGLTSLSPFVFVADTDTLASAATATAVGTAPKTGEMPVIPVAVMVAIMAAAGVAFVSKKRA